MSEVTATLKQITYPWFMVCFHWRDGERVYLMFLFLEGVSGVSRKPATNVMQMSVISYTRCHLVLKKGKRKSKPCDCHILFNNTHIYDFPPDIKHFLYHERRNGCFLWLFYCNLLQTEIRASVSSLLHCLFTHLDGLLCTELDLKHDDAKNTSWWKIQHSRDLLLGWSFYCCRNLRVWTEQIQFKQKREGERGEMCNYKWLKSTADCSSVNFLYPVDKLLWIKRNKTLCASSQASALTVIFQ